MQVESFSRRNSDSIDHAEAIAALNHQRRSTSSLVPPIEEQASGPERGSLSPRRNNTRPSSPLIPSDGDTLHSARQSLVEDEVHAPTESSEPAKSTTEAAEITVPLTTRQSSEPLRDSLWDVSASTRASLTSYSRVDNTKSSKFDQRRQPQTGNVDYDNVSLSTPEERLLKPKSGWWKRKVC
jgi:hypothetical protein